MKLNIDLLFFSKESILLEHWSGFCILILEYPRLDAEYERKWARLRLLVCKNFKSFWRPPLGALSFNSSQGPWRPPTHNPYLKKKLFSSYHYHKSISKFFSLLLYLSVSIYISYNSRSHGCTRRINRKKTS